MPSTITLQNHTLTYTTAGSPDAPALLMVHGWLSHHQVWRQTIAAFQERYFCIALDLLGFGDSDKPADADYSIRAQGQRILQFADALGLDRFILMGHSMGGQIAMYITSMLAPERVTKLVSVAGVVTGKLTPSVESYSYRLIAWARHYPALYHLGNKWINVPWYMKFNCRTWFYNMDSIPFSEWELDRRMALQPDARFSFYEAGQAIHGLNLTPYLHQITVPTLAVTGRQDNVVPITDTDLIQQHIPNSRVAWLNECGHFPMYEQTNQYLDAVGSFL